MAAGKYIPEFARRYEKWSKLNPPGIEHQPPIYFAAAIPLTLSAQPLKIDLKIYLIEWTNIFENILFRIN